MKKNEFKVSSILIKWIMSRHSFHIHQIENEVPAWAYLRYGIMHTPGTFSREFRRMKGGGLKFTDSGLTYRLAETGSLKNRQYKVLQEFEPQMEISNVLL